MNIVKRGKLKEKEAKYIGTCDVCDSVVVYDSEEVYTVGQLNYKGYIRSVNNCPVCKETPIIVTLKKDQ